jgi:hypothetical protein
MIKITPKHCTEAGIVLAMIFILTGLFTGTGAFYKLAGAMLLLDLMVPKCFKPFAFCWFNLSVWLGHITSRIILSVIFVVIIVPVAVIRRLGGKDPLKLKDFKKSASTVFSDRNIKFNGTHLKQTY